MNRLLLIFTDLDGSLLDHDGYSHAGAAPALRIIRARRIPLVFVTSKTRAEIERLQADLDIREPFAAENGGGIFFPAGYRGFRIPGAIERDSHRLIPLGRPYEEIRRFVEERKTRFALRGAADLSLEELVALTGLTPEQALLAKQREFSEPFLLEDGGQLEALREEALAAGLQITRGGRFHHLVGIRQDKGEAVRRVTEIFRENAAGELLTVGIGDRPNDAPMLAAVDIPVVIPHPDGQYEGLALPYLLRARHPGSLGWNEAVLSLLHRFDSG